MCWSIHCCCRCRRRRRWGGCISCTYTCTCTGGSVQVIIITGIVTTASLAWRCTCWCWGSRTILAVISLSIHFRLIFNRPREKIVWNWFWFDAIGNVPYLNCVGGLCCDLMVWYVCHAQSREAFSQPASKTTGLCLQEVMKELTSTHYEWVLCEQRPRVVSCKPFFTKLWWIPLKA